MWGLLYLRRRWSSRLWLPCLIFLFLPMRLMADGDGKSLPEATAFTELPDPLTLEAALIMSQLAHPSLEFAVANRAKADASLTKAESVTGIHAYIDLVPQAVDPVVGLEGEDGIVNDSYARIILSKRLYDFGYSRNLESSALSQVQASEWALRIARTDRYLEVMARFFDVILADMRYAADNEDMAHRYVSFDKARKRRELGQLSDVDVLALENEYQDALIKRSRSQKLQSSSRSKLALALNHIGKLPGDLVRPNFDFSKRTMAEYDVALKEVIDRNPLLAMHKENVKAAEARLEAARSRRWPVVSTEAETGAYEREFGSRNSGRVSLNLRVPLYQGQEDNADIASADADLKRARAQMRQAEHNMRQSVLDAMQDIEQGELEYKAARLRLDYRDLYLDRSRALYEMEVQTTLGDAMALVTDAQWRLAKAEFGLALAWARMDALYGKLLPVSDKGDIKP